MFKEIHSLRAFLQSKKLDGTIGFIPTMGALHAGHASLVKKSKKQHDFTICSIFVNPTQFNNAEDLEKYPRSIEQDILLLMENECDVLFHPDPEEMYPNGFEMETFDWGTVTNTLEGGFRPGHFNGVITIVKKLFEIIEPDHAYFGQKDFQQCAVIRHMVDHFNLPVEIVICDILREADGLAMSSRNVRLNGAERQDALLLSKALHYIRTHQKDKVLPELIREATGILVSSPLIKLEYLDIVNTRTLKPVTDNLDTADSVALIAAWCGNVRLIDNMLLNE